MSTSTIETARSNPFQITIEDFSDNPVLGQESTRPSSRIIQQRGNPVFFKTILLGDCNVGKTSLIRRLTVNQFQAERKSTLRSNEQIINYFLQLKNGRGSTSCGSSASCSQVYQQNTISTGSNEFNDFLELPQQNSESQTNTNTVVGLELWDTLGQERHSSLVSSYYKNASGIMVVYDVTNMESFLNVKSWLVELEEHFTIGSSSSSLENEIAYILVGNKSDMDMQRVVSKERGKQLAEQYGIAFAETSALNGHNCQKAFSILAQNMIDKASVNNFEVFKKKEELSNNSIRLGDFDLPFRYDDSISEMSSFLNERPPELRKKFSDEAFKDDSVKNMKKTKRSKKCCYIF